MTEPRSNPNDFPHDHSHDRPRDDHQDHQVHHGHDAHDGLGGLLRGIFSRHSHDTTDSLDQALEASAEGIRAVALSLVILLATALVQGVVVVLSGSVALLGDTLHNASDAFTAIPLWMAFRLGRRAPTRRFTYGYGKAEDVAGLVVIGLISVSAALAAYEAVVRLLHPHRVSNLGLVMAAAVIGAIGNELVARYRITVGRRIGSSALEADGLHARADGITSLFVLAGAIAVQLGAHWADGAVGILIAAAIVVIAYRAVMSVGQRLLDTVDPDVVAQIETIAGTIPGVRSVTEVRARWAGHRLLAQVRLSVDGDLPVTQAHEIAETVHHELLHHVARLSDAIIHVDPYGGVDDPHSGTRHHLG